MLEQKPRTATPEQLTVAGLRFNRPKNYIGVPLAIAAAGDAGGLTMQYVTKMAGGAKLGAEELGFLTDQSTLSDTGEQLVNKLIQIEGSPEQALKEIGNLNGRPTPLYEVRSEWTTPVQKALVQYPPARAILDVLLDTGPATLSEFALSLETAYPALLEHGFLRDNPAPENRDYNDVTIYNSQVTCQLKSILYHAELLTERGSSTDTLDPDTDVWEVTTRSRIAELIGGELE